MRATFATVPTQEEALLRLARLVEKATLHPLVRRVALQLTAECNSRDDDCELRAIYDAVKRGDSRVTALARGVRYVSDSRAADQFYSPVRLMQECANGACAGDCDDHAALIAALVGAVGFKWGLRAYGPRNGKAYTHVYAVAYAPKRTPSRTIGLDTTVPYADVGWQPPRGRVMTAVAE